MQQKMKYLLLNLLTAARQLLAEVWEQAVLPRTHIWAPKIWTIALMDKITMDKKMKDRKSGAKKKLFEKCYPFILY